MNETDILEVTQKQSIQLTILSVVFVGLMMVFLVPSLTEEAQAFITAKVYTPPDPFGLDNFVGTMEKGDFIKKPGYDDWSHHVVTWITAPDIFLSDKGKVTADMIMGNTTHVFNLGKVMFIFELPTVGSNSCDAKSTNPKYPVECWISGGYDAKLFYSIYDGPHQNNNNHCDILNKFEGFKGAKIIREKLHC